MVQMRVARYGYNRYHNYSSVSNMLNTLNWPQLKQRKLRGHLVMMYKITHHRVAIPSRTTLIPSNSRTRNIIHITSDISIHPNSRTNFHFYPFTIVQWNFLPTTVHRQSTLLQSSLPRLFSPLLFKKLRLFT